MMAEAEVCIVCCRRALTKDVKARKSGFKCKKCVGSPSQQVFKRVASWQPALVQFFQKHGWGHNQPVEWVDDGDILRGFVVCTSTKSWWTDPADAKVEVRFHDGDPTKVFSIDARRLLPVITGTLVWSDGKRGDVKNYLEPLAPDAGGLRYVPVIKAVSDSAFQKAGYAINGGEGGVLAQPRMHLHRAECKAGGKTKCAEYGVTKVMYTPGAGASVFFPELPATAAKAFLPSERKGWHSHSCFLWLLKQLCTAADIDHDLPDVVPMDYHEPVTH
eukprot:TRINITY_DN28130_c0_g1_i1.p1 TRINITY_DN28130_c0_g1~~TRINITY_DN28130_c0_g1_i1.p1  ORF type:complete len:274 (+),score=97.11 TRINITY_DN28130_c0_g1_i1:39-860(+)